LLLADGAFVAALGVVPNDDWYRTWAATRTIMLRMTSKRVNEVLDQMILPAVVRLSRRFWDDARNGTNREKQLEFVLRQLAAMTARCLITTLELRDIEMKGQDAERLAGVLAQCPALAHLDLGDLVGCGTAEAERLEGALGQFRELVYLNLLGNKRPAGGAVLAFSGHLIGPPASSRQHYSPVVPIIQEGSNPENNPSLRETNALNISKLVDHLNGTVHFFSTL
jgi:hypothetical protein